MPKATDRAENNMESSRFLLGPEGPFAQAFSGFAERPGQLDMADAIEKTLEEENNLVIEAGTGVGKTLAYLVPSIQSGKKTLVSTGTRNLQDQIFDRDLPQVLKNLDVNMDIALLKGRANYLCLHRMELAEVEGRFADRESALMLGQVKRWSSRTADGDLNHCPDLAEDSPLIPMITSSSDNCLGSTCPSFESCYIMKARRRALEADLVVVNHHLLFADLAMRQDGFSELLPQCDIIILDEAHQIPETASRFLGKNLSSRQLKLLATDCRQEASQASGVLQIVLSDCENLELNIRKFQLDCQVAQGRHAWKNVKSRLADKLDKLKSALAGLVKTLDSVKESSPGLEACFKRGREARQLLDEMDSGNDQNILWMEAENQFFSFNSTPVNVADPLSKFRESLPASWILTSATLSIAGDFNHFLTRTGLEETPAISVDSPFDYWHNTVLYHPPDMPKPGRDEYYQAFVEASLPVLEISRGRAFLLFTSHRALKYCAELFRQQCDYPLFVQGEGSRAELLTGFLDSGNGLLLGAASFWEGVDVPGQALSCVIIEKLPFAAPDDPVLEARMQILKDQGMNPFSHYQLPEAVLALKQGIGRLIRSTRDYGIVMVADPRLRQSSYGRLFIEALPKIPKTSDLALVRRFFNDRESKSSEHTGH